MLQVRRLCGRDAAAFQAVRLNGLRLHPDAFGSSLEEEVDRSATRIEERLESSFVAGCERDGQLIGVAGLGVTAAVKKRHQGVLWGMYVEPAGRRLGAGKLLVEAVLGHAKNEVEDVVLGVGAHNKAAIALYEQFGFVPYGLEPRALKIGQNYIDEILMWVSVERR